MFCRLSKLHPSLTPPPLPLLSLLVTQHDSAVMYNIVAVPAVESYLRGISDLISEFAGRRVGDNTGKQGARVGSGAGGAGWRVVLVSDDRPKLRFSFVARSYSAGTFSILGIAD